MMDGIINVYKEKGYTSHDVVAKMRGILKQKKIGHTGTLDPAAEGVLPVCLGAGTKLCDLLTDRTKTYRAVLLLGVETDTQDTTGQITASRPVEAGEEEVEQAVLSFAGDYDQIPPMYSALKVDGRKLYELAREGKEVERKARRVQIHEIRIESMDLPRVTMTVTCSKGTYIRTLCHDIGGKLGCGGCMESLVRTKASGFAIEDSLTLAQMEKLQAQGTLAAHVTPVDAVFAGYPQVRLQPSGDKSAHNGNPIPRRYAAALPEEATEGSAMSRSAGPAWTPLAEAAGESPAGAPPQDGSRVRIYDSGGAFIGVYTYDQGEELYRPWKLFLGGKR